MNYKNFVAGGLFGAGILGAIYYLSSEVLPIKSKRNLTRAEIIRLLEELRKELTNICLVVADIVQDLIKNTKTKPSRVKVSEYLQTIKYPLDRNITQIEIKIYQKYKTSQKSVKFSIENTFKNDEDVQNISNLIKQDLENALNGVSRLETVMLPQFLTPETCLRIIEDKNDALIFTLNRKLQELQYRGIQPNPYNEEFIDSFKQAETDADIIIRSIYAYYGLTVCKDPPNLLIRHAIQKYNDDEEFRYLLANIEELYKINKNLVLECSLPFEEIERLNRKFKEVGKNIINHEEIDDSI